MLTGNWISPLSKFCIMHSPTLFSLTQYVMAAVTVYCPYLLDLIETPHPIQATTSTTMLWCPYLRWPFPARKWYGWLYSSQSLLYKTDEQGCLNDEAFGITTACQSRRNS
jgi:hypothetical protein